MAKASRSLVPPPRRPNDGPPLPPELYTEPAEEILVVGEMLHDITTMRELLAGLPFDRDHYRANLRIVAGAAIRTRLRCERLLGESSSPFTAELLEAHTVHSTSVVPEPGAETTDDTHELEAEREPKGGHPEFMKFVCEELAKTGAMRTTDLIETVSVGHRIPSGDVHRALAYLRKQGKVQTLRNKGIMLNRIAE